ncbi:MAG: radical SAM protein [Firmicutes bacterium]|nr:radical SAM protein [Bacillota bacterium]
MNNIKGIRFILGNRCNYQCFYCHHEGYFQKKDVAFDTEKLEAIATYMEKNEIYEISITGGEPFLYWEKLSQILKRFDSGKFHITLNTNLFYLDKYIDEIKKFHPIEFHVNVSSLHHETHYQITGVHTLNKIISNLQLLKKTNHLICLNMIALKDMNEKELIELYQFCIENQFKPRFLTLYTEDKKLISNYMSIHEIMKIFPESSIQKLYSYGRYDIKSKIGNYEIVTCLCGEHDCKRCIKNTYLHLTPTLDIKYCMKKEEVIKLEKENVEESITKAIKRMEMIL